MECNKIYYFLVICFCVGSTVWADQMIQNLRQKMLQCEALAKEGEKLLQTNLLSTACRLFETDKRWRVSDITISVFGLHQGAAICYLDGQDTHLIWDSIGSSQTKMNGMQPSGWFQSNYGKKPEVPFTHADKDAHAYVVDEMRSQGQTGGWISYEWNGSVRFSFVKIIKKGDEELVLGVSFYPDSPQFIIQQLVQQAIWHGQKYGASQLFLQINNPRGPFVIGDMYLWAYDMDGFAFAHGRNLAYVGQNRIDWKDADGILRNRIMIDFIARESKGWVDYNEDGMAKRAYVKELVDPRTGKRYVVGGGYYPGLTSDTVRDLVKRGEAYLKAHGPEIAFRDFTSYVGQFSQGPLHMFAYDLSGVSRADGENPIFIGQSLFNMQAPDGRFLVREMIDTAVKHGNGWINFVNKGAFYSVYVQYVEVPDGKFVIGAGYWPVSKESYASLLADNAVRYLQNNDTFVAFKEFSTNRRDFVYGDLFIQVYAEDGTCLVYGTDKNRVWDDVSSELDEQGYPYINRVLALAKQGGGWLTLQRNGNSYAIYCSLVTKKANEHMQTAVTLPDSATKKDPSGVLLENQQKDSFANTKTDEWLLSEGGSQKLPQKVQEVAIVELPPQGLLDGGQTRVPIEKNQENILKSQFSAAVDRNFIVAVGFYL